VLTESPTPTSTTPGSTLHDEEPDIHIRIVKVHFWPHKLVMRGWRRCGCRGHLLASVGTVLLPVTLAIEQRLYCWEGGSRWCCLPTSSGVVYLPLSVNLRQLTRPLGRGHASCYGYHAGIPINLGGGYLDLRFICQAGRVAIGVRPLGMLIRRRPRPRNGCNKKKS
jgi:hypothetical protein